ncbi:MAG: hypothetical protein ACREIT_12460 [Tepidisphaeraceae bacterium]
MKRFSVTGACCCAIVLFACTHTLRAIPAPLTIMGKQVGQIDVDRNDPLNVTITPGNLSARGLTFIAHFTLSDAFAMQDCCKASDLRWLQRAITSKALPGFPNTDFIDPQQGRQITSGGLLADGLPFNDATFPSLANANNNTNRRQNGSGSHIKDQPFNLVSEAPFEFTGQSLLVCMEENMMLGILGGVEWGFTVNAQGVVTPKAPSNLADGAALRDAFNKDLARDFPGWVIKPADQLWIPLPPAWGMAGGTLGIVAPLWWRLRRMQSAANRSSHDLMPFRPPPIIAAR